MIYKESETVEFKKTTAELKEAVISVVAMLNKHGRAKVSDGEAASSAFMTNVPPPVFESILSGLRQALSWSSTVPNGRKARGWEKVVRKRG